MRGVVFFLHFAAALVPLHPPVRLPRSAVVPFSRISLIRASSDLPRASSSDLSLTAPDCVAPMGVCLVPDTSDECTIEPGRTLGERIFSVPPVLLFAAGALIGVLGRPLWGLFVATYHAYEAAAIARPLITKSATSGVAYLVGDIMAQVAVPRANAEAGSRALNRGRVLRSTAAGLVSHGPQLHVWTVLLERYVNFGGVVWSLPLKIFLDQTFFASYLNAAYCFFIEAMQRRPLREIGRRVRSSWWPSLKASWRFWPIAHAFTYSVVPLHLRVLWVDVLEIVWVAILSSCVARCEPVVEAPAESKPSPMTT